MFYLNVMVHNSQLLLSTIMNLDDSSLVQPILDRGT